MKVLNPLLVAALLTAPEAPQPAHRVHGRRAGVTQPHPWGNRLVEVRLGPGDRIEVSLSIDRERRDRRVESRRAHDACEALMKATLFKEASYSLSKLIEDIDVGEIGLPDIQRPFVWNKTKVRDLFDSMYSGFPVGYLLFWGTSGSAAPARSVPATKQAVPRLLIVDGQQRLTSLYAVLRGLPVVDETYRAERIRIAFRPRDQPLRCLTDALAVKGAGRRRT